MTYPNKSMLKLQNRISQKLFKRDKDGIVIADCFTRLLAGTDLNASLQPSEIINYKSPDCLPKAFKELLKLDTNHGEASKLETNFPFYLEIRIKECCDAGFWEYKHHYEKKNRYESDKINRLATTHAILKFVFLHHKNPEKLKLVYQFLSTFMHESCIPTTSLDAFAKYVKRKNEKGLPQCLINELIDKPSNNSEISDFMKDVIILTATKQTTLLSAKHIETEIAYMISEMPNAQTLGLFQISESKIQKYLATAAAKNAIDYAIAESLEFNKRVLGVLKFTKASAPLVKVHVDGYHFQVQYREDGNSFKSLVGIFFYDEFSEYFFSLSIDESENGDSFLKAFQDFLVATKGKLPRELAMDTYTFHLLKKGHPKLYQFLLDKGVNLHPSYNANGRAALERKFGSLQQRELPKFIYYLGPGIKSKRRLSHPSRSYRIIFASKDHALDKYEAYQALYKICFVDYNRKHVGNDCYTPITRYKEYESNPVTTIDLETDEPYLFYEHHVIKVVGGTIEVRLKEGGNKVEGKTKKSKSTVTPRMNRVGNIYKRRDKEFLDIINDQYFDVYIDPLKPATAFLFKLNTKIRVGEMPLFKIRPSAEYDRTGEDREALSAYHLESQKLRNQFEKSDKDRVGRFKEKTGRNFEDLQLKAEQKKAINDADMAIQIELTEPKPPPPLVNLNKSRRFRRLKNNNDNDLGIIFQDTI